MESLYKGPKKGLPDYVVDALLYNNLSVSSSLILISFYKTAKPIITKKIGLKKVKYTLAAIEKDILQNINLMDIDYTQSLDVRTLKKIREFICVHRFENPAIFEARLYEIQSQIPKDIANEVKYFEIIEKPETLEDAKKYELAFNKGYHLSKIMTYKSRK